MTKHPGDKPPPARESGGFIPNTYQTPNDYADRYMHLLSGDEWKVLSYTVRRTFGFHKYDNPSDRISVSQYQHGKRRRGGGEFLDHGTGLSRPTIIKALSKLCEFGLLVFVAHNNIQANDGDCYALQLDPAKVNLDRMLSRVEEKRQANTRRTSAARLQTPRHRANTHTPSSSNLSDASKSDLPPPVNPTYQPKAAEPVSLTYDPQYVPHTTPGKSDLNTITRGNSGETQNTHTPRARESSPTAAKPVCVCRTPHSSEFCGDVRLAYARSRPQTIRNPDGYAYSQRAVAGEFDDAIRTWVAAGKPVEGSAATAKPRDTSACPDCRGSGSVFDDPTDPKSHRRCKHPKLARPTGAAARASP